MIKNKTNLTIMSGGNKWTSEKIVNKSTKKLQKLKKKKNFIKLFKLAVINSSPSFYVKKLKRRNKLFKEFPFLLRTNLKLHYGLKNALKNNNNSSNNPFYFFLTQECIKAADKNSTSFLTKTSMHQTAFTNKKFINYRWF
jgi:ribosomal protein S7